MIRQYLKKHKTMIINGLIREGEDGDNYSTLYIDDPEYNYAPIASILDDEICNKNVSVKYYISEEIKTKQELDEEILLSISGAAMTLYSSAYSEYTGYLWTDEEIKIGGHDLLAEISDNEGKYIYLEIKIH